MSQAMTITEWLGKRVKVVLSNGVEYYGYVAARDADCLFLSDIATYSLSETDNDPYMFYKQRKGDRLIVPLVNIRTMISAAGEPADGDQTSLSNPFYHPKPDPRPTFALKRPWWRKII